MNYIDVRKEIRVINKKIEYIQGIAEIILNNTPRLIGTPQIANEFIGAVNGCIDMLADNEAEITIKFKEYGVFLEEFLKITTVEAREAVIDIGIEAAVALNESVNCWAESVKAQNRGKTADAEQGMIYEVIKVLKGLKCRKVLDINNCLEKAELITKRFDNPYGYLSFEDMEVDSLVADDTEVSIEAEDNLYSCVLRNGSGIWKKYDAVLLLNELNTTENIVKRLEDLKNVGHYIIIKAPDEGDREIRERYPLKCFQTEHGKVYVLDTQPWEYTGQTALYVVTHKPFELPIKNPMYHVIHAGKNGSEGFGFCGDDTGDNISSCNPYINELTAVYWIWKNDKAHKYIGINHYRRYFSWKGCFDTTNLLEEDTVLDMFDNCDVIIVDPMSLYPETVAETTRKIFIGDIGYDIAYERTRQALEKVHPEDVKYFDKVMNQYKFAACNVFIMKKEFFNEYCNWLFSFILEALEEWLKDIEGKDVNKRAIGFMGERMLAVWLKGHHVRVKPLNGFKLLDI
ncbi:protein of unknown function [Lachnospiraceae bacterium KH1T2]|nr:protein of unknown function [Lachnospiraceae bacterium KH1T2]